MVPAPPEEANDVVVRELDVFLCKPDLGSNTQFCLLQCPLRPAWRPYTGEAAYSEVQYKPQHRRLQLKLPLDTRSENYDGDDSGPRSRMDTLTLDSSVMDMHSAFAVGSIQGDALYLTPIDYGLKMRPTLDHLEAPSEDEEPEAMDLDEPETSQQDGGGSTEFRPLAVNVQKRETERQVEHRTKSYAYLKEAERKEEWRKLRHHPPHSAEAGVVWQALHQPVPQPIDFSLGPQKYLRLLTPGSSLQAPSTSQGTKGGQEGTRPQAPGGTKPCATISPHMRALLSNLLTELFKTQPVNNLDDIRAYLRSNAETEDLEGAEQAADQHLHAAILACDKVRHVNKVYVSKTASNPQFNDFWTFLIEELETKEGMKKVEIAQAAKKKGVSLPPQKDYTRILKELCTSRGTTWALKRGAK